MCIKSYQPSDVSLVKNASGLPPDLSPATSRIACRSGQQRHTRQTIPDALNRNLHISFAPRTIKGSGKYVVKTRRNG